MEKSNCEFKMLKNVVITESGERVTKGKDHIDNGLYYVYGGGDKNEKFKVNKSNREGFNCKISKYGASAKNFISIINDKFWLHDNGFTIKSNNENILLTEYLANFMVLILRTEENYKRLNLGAPPKLSMDIFYELMIPIPKMEIQTKCVEQLNDLSNQKELINSMKDGIKRQMKYFIDSQIQKSVNDNNVEFKMLKDLCEIKNGKAITKQQLNEGNIPVVGGGVKPLGYHNEYNLEENTIIISKDGANAGYVSIYPIKIYASGHALYIDNIKINVIKKKYLYYILKHFEKKIYSFQKGGAQPGINKNEIGNGIMIPIPTLEIQESISQKMNELSDKIKNLDNDIVFIDNLMKQIMQSTYQ